MYENLYYHLEKKIISSIDRFSLDKKQTLELKKDFNKSVVMIVGSAGSIGKEVTMRFTNFNFKRIFLIDKNENELTNLNRDILQYFPQKKLKDIDYICCDITDFNLNDFIIKNNITHYLNFAALKHVRSEENIFSIKYMFKTNILGVKLSTINLKKSKIKKIFSVSTDKAVNPSSLLGVSKRIMESELWNLSKKNKLFVSSARFANVSFSNGSILKMIVDRVNQKMKFGIPNNIKRYFITHQEASSLCLKALLNESNGKIVIPKKDILKQQSIKFLCERILKEFNYIANFVNKTKTVIHKNSYNIVLTEKKLVGQKMFEEFYYDNEEQFLFKKDHTVSHIKLSNLKNSYKIYKHSQNLISYNVFIKILKGSFKKFKPVINPSKVSRLI
jgi:UDP-N-acetylglucosamine 4,6-dehydratase